MEAEDKRLGSGALGSQNSGQEGTPGITKPTPLILQIRKKRCREDSFTHETWIPHSPLPGPWKSLTYFYLYEFNYSHKQNHTVCVLWCLDFFT